MFLVTEYGTMSESSPQVRSTPRVQYKRSVVVSGGLERQVGMQQRGLPRAVRQRRRAVVGLAVQQARERREQGTSLVVSQLPARIYDNPYPRVSKTLREGTSWPSPAPTSINPPAPPHRPISSNRSGPTSAGTCYTTTGIDSTTTLMPDRHPSLSHDCSPTASWPTTAFIDGSHRFHEVFMDLYCLRQDRPTRRPHHRRRRLDTIRFTPPFTAPADTGLDTIQRIHHRHPEGHGRQPHCRIRTPMPCPPTPDTLSEPPFEAFRPF